jgi:hypothetical protein
MSSRKRGESAAPGGLRCTMMVSDLVLGEDVSPDAAGAL